MEELLTPPCCSSTSLAPLSDVSMSCSDNSQEAPLTLASHDLRDAALRVKGTSRMEVRPRRPRHEVTAHTLETSAATQVLVSTLGPGLSLSADTAEGRPSKQARTAAVRLETGLDQPGLDQPGASTPWHLQDSDEHETVAELKSSSVTKTGNASCAVTIEDSDEDEVTVQNADPSRQILRISAGKAAAVAGLNPFSDVGELFLELLYQDRPNLLLRDAALVGVELVSPAAERARLLSKSGASEALEMILQEASTVSDVKAAYALLQKATQMVGVSETAARLTAEEAADLRRTIQSEINVGFGAQHEDAALRAYEARVGCKVYGEQRRIQVALPQAGPAEALAVAFPACGKAPSAECGSEENPYFLLTGFVDGLIDLPSANAVESGETLVVEVKHRMNRIKDPPEVYDIIQLCSYCRAMGSVRGDLVQCLRQQGEACDAGAAAGSSGILHISRVDFSETGPQEAKGVWTAVAGTKLSCLHCMQWQQQFMLHVQMRAFATVC
eukprot:gnl/TRDRNA2_/TRDRNA2_60573_c0_seq2.p1 gnl/TRDRNA2_/TRDRNA2_60573_c0~~gnl/TRDRNA2_/TRDRNA2_60573_c0_seq2.p1  ORF type:complete len:564 (+),score=84.74 gnl/TRDRNA2_/TRDRNA2_60573_c0_seq2:195-1694(+)